MDGLINRQYVGARYVPKLMGEWNKALRYEALCIVTYMGNSFTSKVAVPANVDITDENYWVNTGNYNAQVEEYRAETIALRKSMIIKKITDYGADTELNDNTTFIQNAIDDCAKNGYALYVPIGTFKTTGLVAKDGLVLFGVDMNNSILHFTAGGFTGDPNNHNFYNGGLIQNLTILGNNIDNQTGFDMCMLTSRINKCIAKNFNGYGFDMRDPESVEVYQPLVNNGETHGLSNCSASFCGTGFRLRTWDSLYENLAASRCSNGVDIYSGKLNNVHAWGFSGFGINVSGGNTQLSNVEIEAAITPNISGPLVITGNDISISGLRLWNINVNKFLIWCNKCSNVSISNMVIGEAGTLTSEDATNVQVIGGSGTNLYIQGLINSSYTSGVGYSVTGDGVFLLTGNSNLTNVVTPTNGVSLLYTKIKTVTKTIPYDGSPVNLAGVISEYSNFHILSAKVVNYQGNGMCKVYTYNNTYFLQLNNESGENLPGDRSYTITFELLV